MEVLRRRIMSNTFEEKDYSKEYLTFTAVEDSTFTFTGTTVNNVTNSLSYSLDGGITWVALASGVASPTVRAGDTICWKGNGLSINNTLDSGGIGNFSSTNIFDVSGNPMSLYYGSNFALIRSTPAYIFVGLFKNCDKLRNAVNLSLPATTLADCCYNYMFYRCTSLITAPSLPATTLARFCYRYIFGRCTSLITAPSLPATTLADYCYNGVFYYCTSLTTAPELPATTLAGSCYAYMFNGCTSLTTAPELPATTLITHCYGHMFNGCTSLTTAPELPATTLITHCYSHMFNGCTSLTYIKAMFTNSPSAAYTDNWVSGVASSGTFVKNSAATWDVTGVNGIPSGWTVLTYTNVLPSEYVELEYISSTLTGSQYIDLNINLYATANNTYDLATKFNLKGSGSDSSTQATVFGCQKDVNPWPGTFIRKYGSMVLGRYIGGSNKDNNFGYMNSILELPVQTSPDKNVYTSVGSNTHDWGTSLFCYFSDSNNTPARYAEMDLYYFKLWLNGTLVRDMVPCIKTSGQDSGEVGLYDLLNNVFYTSPNGAAFVAGPVA